MGHSYHQNAPCGECGDLDGCHRWRQAKAVRDREDPTVKAKTSKEEEPTLEYVTEMCEQFDAVRAPPTSVDAMAWRALKKRMDRDAYQRELLDTARGMFDDAMRRVDKQEEQLKTARKVIEDARKYVEKARENRARLHDHENMLLDTVNWLKG